MKTEFKQRQIHARKLYGYPRQGRCWKGLKKVTRAFSNSWRGVKCRPAPQKKIGRFCKSSCDDIENKGWFQFSCQWTIHDYDGYWGIIDDYHLQSDIFFFSLLTYVNNIAADRQLRMCECVCSLVFVKTQVNSVCVCLWVYPSYKIFKLSRSPRYSSWVQVQYSSWVTWVQVQYSSWVQVQKQLFYISVWQSKLSCRGKDLCV